MVRHITGRCDLQLVIEGTTGVRNAFVLNTWLSGKSFSHNCQLSLLCSDFSFRGSYLICDLLKRMEVPLGYHL